MSRLTPAKRKIVQEKTEEVEEESLINDSIENDLLLLRSLRPDPEDFQKKRLKGSIDPASFHGLSVNKTTKPTIPSINFHDRNKEDFDSSDDENDLYTLPRQEIPKGGWLAPPSISKNISSPSNNRQNINDDDNMESQNSRLTSRIGDEYQESIKELRIPSILEGGVDDVENGQRQRQGQQQTRKGIRLESRVGDAYQAVIPDLIAPSSSTTLTVNRDKSGNSTCNQNHSVLLQQNSKPQGSPH